MENILSGKNASPEREISTFLLDDKIRIEKIVSMGQKSDWMTQSENEWVSVLQGLGVVAFDDGTKMSLGQGEHMLIPAGKKHRVEFTSKPCIWLCVFYS